MSSTLDTTLSNVFCHVCNKNSTAKANPRTEELDCEVCGSNFVEKSDANQEESSSLQSFLGGASTQASDISSSDDGPVPNSQSSTLRPVFGSGRDLIQQILNRILGLGIQIRPNEHSTLLNVMQEAAAESGRPIGIVVRQTVTMEELNNLADTLSAIGSSGNGREIGSMLAFSGVENDTTIPDTQTFDDLLHHILMNEASRCGAPPATESLIESLPSETISENNLKTFGNCCISLEPFELGDTAINLRCGHNFKRESIVHWLKMHNTCPVCRISLE